MGYHQCQSETMRRFNMILLSVVSDGQVTRPFLPGRDTESDLRWGWLGLAWETTGKYAVYQYSPYLWRAILTFVGFRPCFLSNILSQHFSSFFSSNSCFFLTRTPNKIQNENSVQMRPEIAWFTFLSS